MRIVRNKLIGIKKTVIFKKRLQFSMCNYVSYLKTFFISIDLSHYFTHKILKK